MGYDIIFLKFHIFEVDKRWKLQQLDEINEITLNDILSRMANEMEDWVIIGNSLGKIIYAKISLIRIKDNELKENSTNKHINSHIKYYYK